MFEMVRRNTAAAAHHIEALVNISREHEMRMWTAYGAFLASWSRQHGKNASRSLAEMRRAIATLRERGVGTNIPFIVTALAEAEAEAGENETALATLDGIIAETERTGQCWFDAETHRIRGEILRKRDPANVAPAEEAFLAAIAAAQQQNARSFELRAAVSMARLWRDQGKRDEARELLAPVYGWFTEGFDTMDLKEAKALLDELRA
jgi:predicted ATPase